MELKMKQTVNFYAFCRAFENSRPNNFSYEGMGILWDYFESYENDCGVEVELDVVAICCDYSEEHWTDIAENYDIDLSELEAENDKKQAVMDYLGDNTTVCGETKNGCFVYQCF
jgi:hypothetical protein